MATPAQDLITKLDAANNRGYAGTFDQAYQNLGQPLHDTSDRGDIYQNGANALINAYVNRAYEKTGQLPSENDVKDFLGNNLNSAYAAKFIQGQITPDQIAAQYVDPYLQTNPIGGSASSPESRIMGLSDQLNKAYEASKNKFTSDYDQNIYNPSKTKTAEDLAGQGMLTNPNSRYALNQVEANKSRDVAGGINSLNAAQASGQVDLGKTVENLLQSQQQIGNQASQFNRSFNAQQDQNAFNQGLTNRGLSLAQWLGQLQAGQQSNNGVSGALGGGLSGAATGAAIGSVVPGLGTALGAGIGGLAGLGLGYFGSKR